MGSTLRLRLASSAYEPREHRDPERTERREREGRDGERRRRKGHELRRREKPAAGPLEGQMDGKDFEGNVGINHHKLTKHQKF